MNILCGNRYQMILFTDSHSDTFHVENFKSVGSDNALNIGFIDSVTVWG